MEPVTLDGAQAAIDPSVALVAEAAARDASGMAAPELPRHLGKCPLAVLPPATEEKCKKNDVLLVENSLNKIGRKQVDCSVSLS